MKERMKILIGYDGSDCSQRMIWVMRCLCLTGLGISGYLAWTAFSMSPVYGWLG